jgi:Methyltransferase domain
VFVDGDHSRGAARLDWDLWHPLVPAGGTVVFHDAREGKRGGRGLPGPTEVVDELFRNGRSVHGWRIVDEVDSAVAVARES